MMFLFEVELEVILFGKEIKYVHAYDKSDAELIAIQETIKEFNCSKEDISTILVKKVNHNLIKRVRLLAVILFQSPALQFYH